MAWPLVGLAVAGAAKKIADTKSASKQQENQWAQAEDERKRRQKQFQLSGIRDEHGAEGRKTIGDIFGKGFLSNFGVDPSTGVARNAQFGAMLADPWIYRNKAQLEKLSPHADPLPKPKGPGLSGYLGAGLGGAMSGAATYYGAGGDFGMPGSGGGGGAAAAPNPFAGPSGIPSTPSYFPTRPPVGPGTGMEFTAPPIY